MKPAKHRAEGVGVALYSEEILRAVSHPGDVHLALQRPACRRQLQDRAR